MQMIHFWLRVTIVLIDAKMDYKRTLDFYRLSLPLQHPDKAEVYEKASKIYHTTLNSSVFFLIKIKGQKIIYDKQTGYCLKFISYCFSLMKQLFEQLFQNHFPL